MSRDLHYHGDRRNLDVSLCGLRRLERTQLTWNRTHVTCQTCATKFDAAVKQIRQGLNWFKKAE